MSERLWAPWRMSYVEKPTTGTPQAANVFVELPSQDRDRENLILFRGQTSFVILNAFPYCNGHVLVAPFLQVADITAMTDEELLEINRLVARCVGWIQQTYKPDGFNIGVNLGKAAGAGIPMHIHWHVVPRWTGDTNFMSSIGDVRVLPEDLAHSYDRLKKVIDHES